MRAPRRSRPSRSAAVAALACGLLGFGACGAGGHNNGGGARTRRAFTAVGATATAPTAGSPASGSCAQTVAGTIGEVATRIYQAAARSNVVGQAVHRMQSSAALARAVSAGSASATRAALDSLLAGQIVRAEVLRGGRQLAAVGSGPAMAPVQGTLPGTGGARFVVSIQADRNYLQVTRQVTGADVVLLAGGRRVAGTIALPANQTVPASGALRIGASVYQVASVSGTVFPRGALQIALLVPAGEIPTCTGPAAQTRAAVLGRVGERIYEEELHSATVAATVRRMEATPAFRSAVAARNATATRGAILGFFAAHIHVVRVRVIVGGRLLVDVGGPYALAPVAGTLRSGGRVVGRFQMAIQDDAGYLRLAQLFTGAQVLMRVGSRQVMGTLSPGPANVPGRGTVSYRGHSYEAYSFAATAFPSGPLRISLLF